MDYTLHTDAVRSIFSKVLTPPISDGEVDIEAVLIATEPRVMRDLLEPVGFADAREAHERLKRMAEGSDGVRFSPHVPPIVY